jgi:RNA polymerase sigma-70 factor (ECF subfamily)
LVPLAVARAKQGDRSALEFLYVRYATEVQRYVASFVGDRHEAEDITQDVFLKLMRVIGKYTQRDVPFISWLRRVARNAALDHLRSRRLVPVSEDRGGEDTREEVAPERSPQDVGCRPWTPPSRPYHIQGRPSLPGGDAADKVDL